jgi:hypothetical protein
MQAVFLWLLVVVSNGDYNRGNVDVLERFPTVEQCEQVRKNLPKADYDAYSARCIQAQVILTGVK